MVEKKQAVISVVGSINMDLTVTTKTMPAQGETVLGEGFSTSPGGKGANQAVAAARLGAKVHMIGALGDDVFGQTLLKHLQIENILPDGMKILDDVPSGIANIILSNQDNRIIVAPGANAYVTPELVEEKRDLIAASDMLLLQLEIPMAAVVHAVEIAGEYHVPVILNPAPYQHLPESVYQGVQFLTPNELEAAAMKEELAGESLQEKRIVTKGAAGAAFFADGKQQFVAGYPVKAVDTTGAGDTFNGALAVALAENKGLRDAVQIANAAAALSVMKSGAQGGMPTIDEVKRFIFHGGEGKGCKK